MKDFGRVRRLFYRDGESLSEISKKTGFRQRLLKQVAGQGVFAFGSHQKPTGICKKSLGCELFRTDFLRVGTGSKAQKNAADN